MNKIFVFSIVIYNNKNGEKFTKILAEIIDCTVKMDELADISQNEAAGVLIELLEPVDQKENVEKDHEGKSDAEEDQEGQALLSDNPLEAGGGRKKKRRVRHRKNKNKSQTHNHNNEGEREVMKTKSQTENNSEGLEKVVFFSQFINLVI